MIWSTGDYIAVYAAIVATGALALEVRRWFENKPRLSISASPNMKLYLRGETSDATYLTVTVSNRGQSTTTVTHFGLNAYPTIWRRIRNKPSHTMAVPMANPPGGQQLPHILQPGHHWSGMAIQDDDVARMIKAQTLWVTIYAAHRQKPFYKRVPNVRRHEA
jgi:hypothetical protein